MDLAKAKLEEKIEQVLILFFNSNKIALSDKHRYLLTNELTNVCCDTE